MSEDVQDQISQDEFERRRKEAEELLYHFFLYGSSGQYPNYLNLKNQHDDDTVDKFMVTFSSIISRSIYYLANHKNCICDYSSFESYNAAFIDENGEPSLNLPKSSNYKIPMNQGIFYYNKQEAIIYISDFINSTFQAQEEDTTLKNTAQKYIKNALQLYGLYKSTRTCFKNRYLYDEILRWYPNASVNQILTAAIIFKHSPWYNKWSFLTYYSQSDLDAISEIYKYFSPMDPEYERSFFRYFYNHRKTLGQNVSNRKYDLIGNFIKSGWQPDNLIKNFSSDEQNLIKTWLQNPDIAEIATTENVIRNLLILNKTQGINPVEFVQKMKQDRIENGAEGELTNSYIRKIFDTDVLDEFSKDPLKKFIPFDVESLPQPQKEFFVSALVSNAASCMSSNEWPIMPENALDLNPNLKNMFFVGDSNYCAPYQSEIDPNLQKEILDLIIKNFEVIKQDILSKHHELSMDAITAYLQDAFGFKLENESYFYDNASATYKLYSLNNGAKVDPKINSFMATCLVQLNNIARLFEQEPTLLAIRSLNDPENVFIKTDADQTFINGFIKVLKTTDPNELHDKLVTLLSRINLNMPFSKGIMCDSGIAQQFQNLRVDVLSKKREFISQTHKNDFSDDFLALLPKKVCEQDEERLVVLKNLSDNLDKVKNSISDSNQKEPLLNAIIVSDKSIIDCVINLANAKTLDDISQATLNYIQSINNISDPILCYLFSYTNHDLLCAIFEQTKNSFLIKTILDKKINMRSENIKFIIALLNKNDFNIVFICRNQFYSKYKMEIETEKEIRDILAGINNLTSDENTQSNLYLFANSMYLNAMHERDRGITDDQNDSLYIFNQVRERLPEGLAKEIFTRVTTQDYKNAFRTKINSAKEQKQAVSLSQSFLSEQTL